MKLKIKNFGPLTKGGTIDLDKRFYVFVGKNGSGKTYMANLMYGLYNLDPFHLFGERNVIPPEYDDNQSMAVEQKELSFLKERKIKNDFLQNIFEKKQSSLFKNANLITYFSYEEDFINKEIKAGISYEKENKIELYSYSKEKSSNIIFWKKENESTRNDLYFILLNDDDDFTVENSNNDFWKYLFPMVISQSRNCIFLPANRTSLLSMWRYIASTERKEKDILFDINSNGKLLSKDELKNFQPLYTKPVKELIDQIESFDAQSSEPKNNYPDLVQELEELMGGKIKVHEPKEGIGRKRFTFEMAANGEELELFLASSAVNQLSTLYIYLKYWAGEKGNFLMIDEPEINLHPENQIKLVNILMKFADRNDNRVLITTHSTLLTDIINNHVRIGYLQTKGEENTEWLKNHQLDINENITYKDFGVYHFTGNAIEEYPVGEYGVAFKDFNKVIKEVEGLEDELKDQIYSSLRQEEN